VFIAGRDLGFPPITDHRVAAGTYRVELRCPDEGDNKTATVSVPAGQPKTEIIR
jgi:hypothetical protein